MTAPARIGSLWGAAGQIVLHPAGSDICPLVPSMIVPTVTDGRYQPYGQISLPVGILLPRPDYQGVVSATSMWTRKLGTVHDLDYFEAL